MAYFRSLSRSSSAAAAAAANRFTPHLSFSSTAAAAPHLTQPFAGLVLTDPRKDQPRVTGSAGFRLMKGVDTGVFDVDPISPGSRMGFTPFEFRIHPAVSRATGSHLFTDADPDSRTVHCKTITDGTDGDTLEPRKFKVSYDKLANESEAKALTLGIPVVTDHALFLRERIQPRIQERAEKEKRGEQMLSQHLSQRMPQEKTESGTDRLGFSGAGNFKSMNFVQSILEEDEQGLRKKSIDLVHVFLTRKKTFVTVTDARGNKKTGASAGCLEDRKGRSRLSRYAAEATAEHVGRSARKMGLKSVVVKVKGSIFFRKKKKVILSWREGFRGEGVGDQSPIMSIHDVTQLPHNGCRLPKKRRV